MLFRVCSNYVVDLARFTMFLTASVMCVAAGPVRPCLAIFAGGVVATPESLILSADEMGVEREEAVHVLVDMATQITE